MMKRGTTHAASMRFNRRRAAEIRKTHQDEKAAAKKAAQKKTEWDFLVDQWAAQQRYSEVVLPALIRCLEA